MQSYFKLLICLFVFLNGCVRTLSKGEITRNLIGVLDKIDTYSYEMQMEMETSIAGEDLNTVVKSNTHADIDVKNKKMKAFTKLIESNKGKTRLTQLKVYILDTMEYLQSGDAKWVKFGVSRHKLESENQLKKQVNLIINAKIKNLEFKTLGNIDCYLLSLEPNKPSFWKVVMEQEKEHPLLKLLHLDYKQVVKHADMKVWISKDKFFLLKCIMKMRAVIEKQIMKQPFKMIIEVKKTYRYYNHNKPLVIKLPAQAKKASVYQEED